MNKILTLFFSLIAPAGFLSAQALAGDPAGLVVNNYTSAETVNIFSFPPVFGNFDNIGEDSLDLNRDGQSDVFFSCGTCNTFDCDGGYAQLHSLHAGVEFLVDSVHMIRQLATGQPINDTMLIWEEAQYSALVTKVYGIGGLITFGNWIPQPFGYAAVRIKTSTDTLYGWIGILATVNSSGSATVRVQDWAFEHDPTTAPFVDLSVFPEKAVYCAGDTVTFHAETIHADHIAWHFWDGTIDSSDTAIRVLPDSTVWVTFLAGNQFDSSSLDMLLGVSPLKLNVSGGVLTCSTPFLELNATTNIPAEIMWITMQDTFTGPNPPFITAPGPLLVIARDEYGCSVEKQVEISMSLDIPLALIQLIPGVDSLFVVAPEAGISYGWLVPGSTDTIFALSVPIDHPGIYTLVAKNLSNGCVSVASLTASVSGVKEELTSGIALFPNPVEGILSITNTASESFEFRLWDIASNATLKRGLLNGNTATTVDLNGLSSGVYWFSATSLDGKRRLFKKIIKI